MTSSQITAVFLALIAAAVALSIVGKVQPEIVLLPLVTGFLGLLVPGPTHPPKDLK